MKYENFVIEVDKKDDAYTVRVASSPAGESKKENFEPPFAWEQLETTLTEMERSVRRRGAGEPAALPRKNGEKLFDALFREDVGRLFDRSCGNVAADRGLRLQLKLNPGQPELDRFFALPWEYLRDAGDDLSLNLATPVVRYLDVPRASTAVPPLLWVLRILVVMASPTDRNRLNLKADRRRIEEAWKGKSGVELEFLEHASFEDLRKKLRQKRPHILHFTGHGDFNAETGKGELFFENADGTSDPRSGEALATELKNFRSLRLVFLNACDTARATGAGGLNPFSGVATALVMGGMPAVLAMQFPISDDAAITFSQCCYEYLAKGCPVDVAVTEGRLAVRHSDEGSMEWGTPVLFLRIPDGRLFTAVSRRQILAAGGLAVVSVAGGVWKILPDKVRRSLAVLPFVNVSGDADVAWLATALAEIIAASLGIDGALRTLKSKRVERGLREARVDVHRTAALPEEKLAQVQRRLGTDYYVTGAYRLEGEILHVDLKLEDQRREELHSNKLRGSSRDLADLALQAGGEMRPILGLKPLAPEQRDQLRATVPPLEAVRFYFEGRSRYQFDGKGAREFLERAVQTAPDHPLPHYELAVVFFNEGHTENAIEQAKLAKEFFGAMSDADRHELQAFYHETRSDWPLAIEKYRTLFDDFPDEPDYADHLVRTLIEDNRSEEALNILDKLRRLPPPLSDAPWIDLRAARVHYGLGDFKMAKKFADSAAEGGTSAQAWLLVAEASLEHAKALVELGDIAEAVTELDMARTKFEYAGDRAGVAETKEMAADLAFARGDLKTALIHYEECLKIYSEIGHKQGRARCRINLGMILWQQGRLVDAEESFSVANTLTRKMDDHWQVLIFAGVGMCRHLQGELDAALEKYRKAEALAEALGDDSSQDWITTLRAEIFYLRGDLGETHKLHKKVFDRLDEIEKEIEAHLSLKAYNEFRIGKISFALGELFVARGQLQAALDAQEGIPAAETRIDLARVFLAQDKAGKAVEHASQAERTLSRAEADIAALALVVLVEAKLAQGDLAGSRAANRKARIIADAEECEDRRVLFATAIAGARVDAASGQVEPALAHLSDVIDRAAAIGFFGYELEARLAAAEIEAANGRAEARVHLLEVRDLARQKGFGFVGKRAARLLGS